MATQLDILLNQNYLDQIYYVILGKSGQLVVAVTKDNKILDHLSLRELDEKQNEIPIITIDRKLFISFDSRRITNAEKQTVISFLEGTGFNISY